MVSAESGASSPDCPVLVYNGYTYWAWSQAQNGMGMAIVAYDAAGNPVKQWNFEWVRYVWNITIDPVAETVAFLGQGNKQAVLSWNDLFIPSFPNALPFVNVSAHDANCIFASDCTVSVSDSTGPIPMPVDVTGSGQLLTRTFSGAAGTAGAGKTVYEYRVDMSQAASSSSSPCVTDLSVDFGPSARLSYDGTGQLYDAFVVDKDGLGNIGLFSVARSGNTIEFVFNQPVCAGYSPGEGHASDFIGVASASAPRSVTAHVGWPGSNALEVDARAPAHAGAAPRMAKGHHAALKHVPAPGHQHVHVKPVH